MCTTVLLFYKYVTIPSPQLLKEKLQKKAQELNLVGRIIVAEEGINGTVEGDTESTNAFVSFLHAQESLHDMSVKESKSNGNTFPRLKVKVRSEIVGTRYPAHVDPRKKTATHVAPSVVRDWFEKGEDVTVIDMRNSYEYASGHFKGSIEPGINYSRELPQVMSNFAHLKDKKILTVCTGGVRCEKMSAFLLHEGFTDVHQLDGGIHSYMQQFPGKDFEGTLYTFDKRVVMDFGGDRPKIGICTFCVDSTERYINCEEGQCLNHFLACTDCAPENRSRNCGSCRTRIIAQM